MVAVTTLAHGGRGSLSYWPRGMSRNLKAGQRFLAAPTGNNWRLPADWMRRRPPQDPEDRHGRPGRCCAPTAGGRREVLLRYNTEASHGSQHMLSVTSIFPYSSVLV